LSTDAGEQCSRLAIRKALKGKKMNRDIEQHAQQMLKH